MLRRAAETGGGDGRPCSFAGNGLHRHRAEAIEVESGPDTGGLICSETVNVRARVPEPYESRPE